MAIKWSQDLSVGVNEIDSQHKELFETVNNLIEAMAKAKGKEEIGKVISFLEKYVVTHFGTEERYMAKFNYPDYASHKEMHSQFVKDFISLKKELEAGASTISIIHIQRRVVDWLINHIGKVDKVLGGFLQGKI